MKAKDIKIVIAHITEMQIIRYCFIKAKKFIWEKPEIFGCFQESVYFKKFTVVGLLHDSNSLKTVWRCLKTLWIELPDDFAILLLNIYLKNI